jgi:hypothetical protein
MPTTAALWVLALACGDDEADAPADPTQPADEAPAPYLAAEADPPAPTASLTEIAAAAQAALDGVRGYGARPLEAAYVDAMVGQEPACPDVFANDYGSYWYDSCTSSAGTTFSGYAFAYAADEVVDPTYGLTYTYWTLYGAGTVTDPGGTLALSGSAFWLDGWTEDGQVLYWQTGVSGTFSADGPAGADSWLAEGGSDPDLTLTATSYPAYQANYLSLDGGYAGFGEGGWAASFDDLELMDALLGTGCPAEPGGAMAIRSADGGWYDLLFQGATSLAPASGEGCDGCAEVYFAGEPIGLACVDLTAALGWEAAPW